MERTFECKIVGVTPLLMHWDISADPLSKQAQEFAKVSSIRKKTLEDHEAMARIEWDNSLYRDAKGCVCVPWENIRACIRDAAKKWKQGKDVTRELQFSAATYALEYDGPKNIGKLAADPRFRDRRRVPVGNKSRVNRTRPIFHVWELTFAVSFDDDECDVKNLRKWLMRGGNRVGLCDYRPSSGGHFGKFTVAHIKEVKE